MNEWALKMGAAVRDLCICYLNKCKETVEYPSEVKGLGTFVCLGWLLLFSLVY